MQADRRSFLTAVTGVAMALSGIFLQIIPHGTSEWWDVKKAVKLGMIGIIGVAAFFVALPGFASDLPVESIQRDARMAWWREARFGMFIHWGVYAVAAGEWNGEEVPGIGEWIMYHGKISVPEYETLSPKFNPVRFDAAAWVGLAKRAGMKYIVITSKHHDGFCMFDSALTNYDIVDATPFKRDPLKELADECAKQGIRLCFYHSILDWHHPDFRPDRMDEYIGHLKGQLRELLTNYGPIGVLWFDGEWADEWTEARGRDLYEFCRSIQPGLIINNRVGKGRDGMAGLSKDPNTVGDFGTPEQEVPSRGFPCVDWESCMTMNDTWGFKASDHNWKSSGTLIQTLIDTASKGGNFLLNVGPTALGEIPPESVERLEAIGKWLMANGEGIYGTAASPLGQQPWGAVTRRKNTIYLHVVEPPEPIKDDDYTVVIRGLQNEFESVQALSEPQTEITWLPKGLGVGLDLANLRASDLPTVVRIELIGEPEIMLARHSVGGGETDLEATYAGIEGRQLRLETIDGQRSLGFWTDREATATWNIEVTQRGRYLVEIDYACQPASAGSAFTVIIGGQTLRDVVIATDTWHDFHRHIVGEADISQRGPADVVIKPEGEMKHALMNLRGVRLTLIPDSP